MKKLAKPESERDLLDLLQGAMASRLPPSWRLDLKPETGRGRFRPDAALNLVGPDGTQVTILVEARTTLNARDVPSVVAQLEEMQKTLPDADRGTPIVISRYMAPRTREMLSEAGMSYVDATGNTRISIESPALYLEAPGADSDPWRGPERQTRSLRGKPASRVVRALVDFRAPLGVRELAERSGASVGSTYRTVDFLEKEALITRGPRGNVASVNWRELLLRWSEDYSFQESNRITAALEPRGIDRVLEKLRQLEVTVPYAVTGALSANRVSKVAVPRLVAILTPDVERLAEELEVREVADAPNVLLAKPFDDVLLARSSRVDNIAYAAFSQTAADLMTSPGRGPAEAEDLLRWMTADEDVWRG
jgi:hypothetical protein